MMRHDLCAGILQFLDRRLCGSLWTFRTHVPDSLRAE